MNRRGVALGGVAVAAVAAGLGGALWRSRAAASAPGAELWGMSFDKPDGGTLRLAPLRGKPLLLNFWATWCAPCVTEMPQLDRFYREQQASGWQVVGLAVDNGPPVLEFLAKRPVGFAIGLAGVGGIDLARTLGNSGGALPFSVVFDTKGQVLHRKLGVVTPQDLKDWVQSAA